jgi:hypothetical protein
MKTRIEQVEEVGEILRQDRAKSIILEGLTEKESELFIIASHENDKNYKYSKIKYEKEFYKNLKDKSYKVRLKIKEDNS